MYTACTAHEENDTFIQSFIKKIGIEKPILETWTSINANIKTNLKRHTM